MIGMRDRLAFVVVFFLGASPMLANAGDDNVANSLTESSTVVILVKSDFFDPSDTTVEVGTTVEWQWVGSNHSATSGTFPTPDGIFDSGVLNSGATFSHTFDAEGTFPYYCKVHGPPMNGTIVVTPVTAVDDEAVPLPARFALTQNYPNPFNPSTTIRYELPSAAEVRLTIHNILGQEVAVLVEGRESAGEYEVIWNASVVASGIYFTRLVAKGVPPGDQQVDTKKLVLLK